MRKNRYKYPINNGGWHYSYLGGKKRIKNKIESFSHSEFNKKEFTNFNHIKECMNNNKDLFGRNKNYKIVDLDENSPECIKKFIDKYPYIFKKERVA